MITPDASDWDPYSEHYASNEESMLDWEGRMIDRKYRKKQIVEISSLSVTVGSFEGEVDKCINDSFCASNHVGQNFASMAQSEIGDFAASLNSVTEASKFKMSVGSTSVGKDECGLFYPSRKPVYDTSHLSDLEANISAIISAFHANQEDIINSVGGEKPIFDHFDRLFAEIDTAYASKPKSVSADFISKIWQISNEDAIGVLKQNTQLLRQGADNDLSRHFSTNDRMLRYRCINSQFYTDTFFASSQATSTRGNTCGQMFVSDK